MEATNNTSKRQLIQRYLDQIWSYIHELTDNLTWFLQYLSQLRMIQKTYLELLKLLNLQSYFKENLDFYMERKYKYAKD